MAPRGRPRAIKSAAEFEKLAEKYFNDCEENGKKISWTGLCLAVGVTSRQGLDKYKNGTHGSDFVGPIKRALLRVEQSYEERGDTFSIFALKNFNWRDKQEVDVTVHDPAERLKRAESRMKGEDGEG